MTGDLRDLAHPMLRGLRGDDGWAHTGVGLRLRRIAHPRPIGIEYHGPLCGIVIQGTKEVVTGDRRFRITAGDAIIVSHHLPAVSRVVDGSRARPYVAAALAVDLTLLGALHHELGGAVPGGQAAGAIETTAAGPDLAGAFARLLALAARPVEARVLAPLIVREIHLRLLLLPQGAVLRALLSRDSRASRISRVIAHLRRDSTRPHAIPELARIAGMGPSSFHAHFKTVTGTTPLGFQKELRLMRARDLLLDPESSVASVAFAVGYESPTQFSREYSRRFGSSPRDHREVAEAAPG
ncbi:AraC family transcriptional regulator [Pararoseomonas sp. SCSIO 73927]|uniref:AraC family transcriptional regulator n=1 Tax=Pararoseomonas sp. SCSIO 73927 TaxID=3114537 RepID=UPI0030D2BF73